MGARILLVTRKAILLVDHGSRREEANVFLEELARYVRERVDDDTVVHTAHMDIATPSIAAGMRACAKDGAEEVVVVPCFLAPGRHAREDVPRLVEEAVKTITPTLAWKVADALGAHPLLAELVVLRAGVPRAKSEAP